MAYRLSRETSTQKNVREIALDQIDKAIAELVDETLADPVKVHQVRKRCKKLRGLVRLVRPAFAGYQRENTAFRDTARLLGPARDAKVMVETFDALMEAAADDTLSRELQPVRQALLERRENLADSRTDLDARLRRVLLRLRRARQRVAGWQLDDSGFDALEGGLKKTYRRGRKALRAAYADPGAGKFHDWRKRVKYHDYHLRLLRNSWPAMMHCTRDATDALGDLLGDDHDLVVLRALLTSDPEVYGSATEIHRTVELIERRSAALREAARPLGERVFAEKPKALCKRLQRYWDVWQD
jgi:CHAD domain-containing protein